MQRIEFKDVVKPTIYLGNEDPIRVVSIKNFIPPELVDEVLNILKTQEYQKGGIENQKALTDTYRTSQIKWIDFEEKYSSFWSFLHREITKVNSEIFNFNLSGIEEMVQYTEYDESYKGKYDWHLDIGGRVPTNRRKISMTIQLSDPKEYEGGDVLIYKGGTDPIVCEKEKYSATLFPSYLLHKVTPVSKGNRKSLVSWFGGCPFK